MYDVVDSREAIEALTSVKVAFPDAVSRECPVNEVLFRTRWLDANRRCTWWSLLLTRIQSTQIKDHDLPAWWSRFSRKDLVVEKGVKKLIRKEKLGGEELRASGEKG